MCSTHAGGVKADCPTGFWASQVSRQETAATWSFQPFPCRSGSDAFSHVIFKSAIKIIMYYVFPISQNVNRIHCMSTAFGNYMLALSVCCTIDLVMCGRVELHLPQVTTRPAPSIPIISSALCYNNSQLLYIYIFFPFAPRTSGSAFNQTESWPPVKFIF